MKEEIIWFDKDDNIVESSDDAVKGVIRELDEHGDIVQETWLFPEG